MIQIFKLSNGVSSSSDEWRHHFDAQKIVDDILVWAPELPQLIDRVKIFAERCNEINVILSKKKFNISNEISFAGLVISSRGIKPDPKRIKALT